MGEGEPAGRGLPEEQPIDKEFQEAQDAERAGFTFKEDEVLADVSKQAESLRHNDQRMEKLMGKPELLKTAGRIIADAFAKKFRVGNKTESESGATTPVERESHIPVEREERAKYALLLAEWAAQAGVAKEALPTVGLNQLQLEDKFWEQMDVLEDLHAECQASQGQGDWTESERQAVVNIWSQAEATKAEVKQQKTNFKAAFMVGDAAQLKKNLRVGFVYFKDQLPELKKHSHELKQLLLRHQHEG